ncbi:energy transducer TonB [Hymenobacter bucti]|uniref:Energy transducer TonB n=1 Tax=Hymenobacter bucti TaxID=1844114 RepID=A0ABW4QW17_9BACT
MSLLSELFPASFDDLVFEGRNQAYGAYQLRQAYNGHLRTAMALMIGLCALLLLGGAAWQHLHPLLVVAPRSSTMLTPITPPTYVTEPPKPIAPPAAPSQPRLAAAPATHMAASIPTKVVKDELATVRKPDATVVEVPTETPGVVGTTTTETTNTSANTGPGTAITGSETGSDTSPAVTGPYTVVEQMPEFAGGMAALTRYLRSHLRYPGAALAAQAEGRVFVSFVVQADGTIADITVPKGLGYGLDEEAQRVVRQMPAWTPGRQSHHAVPVRFTLPITFRIQ